MEQTGRKCAPEVPDHYLHCVLREKCPNTEFCLVRIFSPNTGKYGLEKTRYLDTFHAVLVW